jgi:DNA repair protein RecO (recombination protein O)
MHWNDDAILLAARPHGENGLLVSLLTSRLGRHAGLVPGGQSRRHRAVWQSGNLLAVRWQARLADHLGTVGGEVGTAYASRWLDDPPRLAAVGAACAMGECCLPERVPQEKLFAGLLALFAGLDQPLWPTLYVHWELGLLGALGFGLDLGACAATGATTDLAYVSPKSGRAVCRSAGLAYHDRLLPLPAFLRQGGAGSPDDIVDGLALTGYFIDRHILAPQGRSLPAARSRLVDRLRA